MTAVEKGISGNGKIKALVVDDSAFMRVVISDMLNAEPEIEVIGVARNGIEAVAKTKTLSPDVITMDVEMPKMNGIEAVKQIMAEKKTPIIMVSGITKKNADVTLEALANGAFDFVTKPSGTLSLDIDKVRDELIAKIKSAYVSACKIGVGHGTYEAPIHFYARTQAPPAEPGRISRKVIVIGSSTGGPKSLDAIFSAFPDGIPAGMLVVQHMPPYFTKSLAERLDSHSHVHVKEAEDGDAITNGFALVAPGDYHMTLNSRKVHMNQKPKVNAVRPSVDITMQSIAKTYGSNVVGVILTGMGKDGAVGMKAIKERGGKTIACDEKTSIIFGMPKEAIKLGCIDKVLPLHAIAGEIVKSLRSG